MAKYVPRSLKVVNPMGSATSTAITPPAGTAAQNGAPYLVMAMAVA